MRAPLDTSTLVLAGVAVAFAIVASPKSSMLTLFSLLLAGLMQALASTAGVITSGGPMVTGRSM
jgi:hypothetical protein